MIRETCALLWFAQGEGAWPIQVHHFAVVTTDPILARYGIAMIA